MKNKISEYCDIAMVAIAVNEKEKGEIIEMNKDKTLINGLEIFKDTTSPKEGWDSVFLSRKDYLKLLELKELINQSPPLPSEIEEAFKNLYGYVVPGKIGEEYFTKLRTAFSEMQEELKDWRNNT